MGFCPQNCADITLIGNPSGGCDFDFRERTVNRLLYIPCKLALPTPFTEANTVPLFENGSIVASMPLANVQWSEPEISTTEMAACVPDVERVESREMTFEDNIAVVLSDDPATSGVNEANPYWDYDFYKDKMKYRMMLRYGIVFCNGDVILARDLKGALAEASFNAYINYKDKSAGKGKLEFKSGKIKFKGDPISFVKPDFNLNDFGIIL